MNKYLNLAKEQFFQLKEDILDEDRHSLGGSNQKEYNIDGEEFKIEVEGFWEKTTWFSWTAIDNSGNIIDEGDYI